ncbi:LPXTG cell wall anchor domain-containing protein [Micromonospora maritima]|nr:LPXTG cell wall anchor domain-containing protein [Micromonospora maritima]
MSILAAILAAVSVAANLTGHTTTAIIAGLGAAAAGVAFHVRRRRQEVRR